MLIALGGLALLPTILKAQALVFERVVSTSPQYIRSKDDKSFLADDFRVGKKGEGWMIDRVRIWAARDGSYSAVTLFGGLLEPTLGKQAKSANDCDCHGIIRSIKTVNIDRNALHDSKPSPIDFNDVRWSVPGGTDVQFGVKAMTGSGGSGQPKALLNAAVAGERDHLRVFDSEGKFQSLFASAPAPQRIAIQVWAHLLIDVKFRASQSGIEVVLKGDTAFDVKQIDRRTLKVEGRTAEAGGRLQDATGDGKMDLVLPLSRQSIPLNSAVACVQGSRLDGVPFEGCDVIPK
jgi:hypothetical protein